MGFWKDLLLSGNPYPLPIIPPPKPRLRSEVITAMSPENLNHRIRIAVDRIEIDLGGVITGFYYYSCPTEQSPDKLFGVVIRYEIPGVVKGGLV